MFSLLLVDLIDSLLLLLLMLLSDFLEFKDSMVSRTSLQLACLTASFESVVPLLLIFLPFEFDEML